jgi:hypothetical protein
VLALRGSIGRTGHRARWARLHQRRQSREALRAAASSGFGRYCRLVVAGCVLRPTRSRVRRLLDASDVLVARHHESAVVDAAAEAFLLSVLGPVAPRP